jgi:hypothetical protein
MTKISSAIHHDLDSHGAHLPTCQAQTEIFNQTLQKQLMSLAGIPSMPYEDLIPALAFTHNMSQTSTASSPYIYKIWNKSSRLMTNQERINEAIQISTTNSSTNTNLKPEIYQQMLPLQQLHFKTLL